MAPGSAAVPPNLEPPLVPAATSGVFFVCVHVCVCVYNFVCVYTTVGMHLREFYMVQVALHNVCNTEACKQFFCLLRLFVRNWHVCVRKFVCVYV